MLNELSKKRGETQDQSCHQEYQCRSQVVHRDGSQLVLGLGGLRDIPVSVQLLHDPHVQGAAEILVDLMNPRSVERELERAGRASDGGAPVVKDGLPAVSLKA